VPISEMAISSVCLYNGGACIATGEISRYLERPTSVYTEMRYVDAKPFLSDFGYGPTTCETQRHIRRYDDGTQKVLETVVFEYYTPDDPETAPKIYYGDPADNNLM